MNLQPTLQNELVLLRPLDNQDFDALYAVAQDPRLWEQHPAWDRYKEEVFAKLFQESIDSGGAMIILDKDNNTVIGSSRFKPSPVDDQILEIGWSFLSRDYWGGRYNRSFKFLMLEHAFRFVDHVVFYIGNENFRSQRATEKLGGKRIIDGAFKHLLRNNGKDWTYIIHKEVE